MHGAAGRSRADRRSTDRMKLARPAGRVDQPCPLPWSRCPSARVEDVLLARGARAPGRPAPLAPRRGAAGHRRLGGPRVAGRVREAEADLAVADDGAAVVVVTVRGAGTGGSSRAPWSGSSMASRSATAGFASRPTSAAAPRSRDDELRPGPCAGCQRPRVQQRRRGARGAGPADAELAATLHVAARPRGETVEANRAGRPRWSPSCRSRPPTSAPPPAYARSLHGLARGFATPLYAVRGIAGRSLAQRPAPRPLHPRRRAAHGGLSDDQEPRAGQR